MSQTNNTPFSRRITIHVTTHPMKNRVEVLITIRDPATGKRYTYKNLRLALLSVVEKDPMHTSSVENWLRKIDSHEGIDEEKVFGIYFSAATKKAAVKLATEKCTGELRSLLHLLDSVPSK